MSFLSALIRTVATRWQPFVPAWRALRARWFFLRVKMVAARSRALVDVRIAPDSRIGRDIDIMVRPGSRGVLSIGSGALVDDDVRILLLGGEIHIGPGSEVRRGCLLDVSGRLTLEGENVLSWGTVIHCAEQVVLRRQATCGEFTTFADSSHFFSDPADFHRHNVRTAPIEVGSNTWIGAKATIARGVEIGDHCVVAANSVVTRDVASGHLVSGVPADQVKPLELPWRGNDDQRSA